MIRSADAAPRRLTRAGAIILIFMVEQLTVAVIGSKNKSRTPSGSGSHGAANLAAYEGAGSRVRGTIAKPQLWITLFDVYIGFIN